MAVQFDNPQARSYLLGDYRLEPEKRRLWRNGAVVRLSHKPLQVLLYLIEHRDRVVSRQELLDQFWDGKDVYDDTLRKAVGAIRKALDEDASGARFIETHYGEGYRYVGPFAEEAIEDAAPTIEVERVRGLHIIIEEDDSQAPLAQAATATLAGAAEAQAHRRWVSPVALTLSLVAVVLGAIGITLYYSQTAPRSNQPPASAIHSVAVLPLKNLSGDPDNEYFADGLTETFITELSKIGGLKVISRGSVFTFKGKEVDPREAGRRLGVAAVLEGSVRRSGDQVRVDVRLVGTEDGKVLWAGDARERAIGDIFAVQDEIARHVASALRIKLSGGDQQLARRYTDNVEAYQAYLKGRYFLSKRTAEGITRGIEYFKQAIALDPNYALAYAGLTAGYDKAYWFMRLPAQAVTEKEREAATRALALDDSLAEAHLAMATVYGSAWEMSKAAGEIARAIEINPGDADVHHQYAYCLVQLGRLDEAVAEIQLARELDPLNVVMNVDVGEILLYAGRYDEAIEALRQAIEMDAGRANAHFDLAQAYERKGMEREAIEEYFKNAPLDGWNPDEITAMKEAYAASGVRGFWQTVLEKSNAKSKRGYIAPFVMARLHARLGETNQAFDWLERAFAEHSPALLNLQVDPVLAMLRTDPRYTDLLRRVGFAQ
ncbi:MAG TPA: tetratricopeptide repeat protein [Blastocatellia bacterium]|nr:tetratricopeptide repeat protein [Blastocatellia bacterium]